MVVYSNFTGEKHCEARMFSGGPESSSKRHGLCDRRAISDFLSFIQPGASLSCTSNPSPIGDLLDPFVVHIFLIWWASVGYLGASFHDSWASATSDDGVLLSTKFIDTLLNWKNNDVNILIHEIKKSWLNQTIVIPLLVVSRICTNNETKLQYL